MVGIDVHKKVLMAVVINASSAEAKPVRRSICIYQTRLPDGFTFVSGLTPDNYDSFAGAINLSLGSLMTLSTGVYSKSSWLQILMGTESVLGFVLLTASISWILSIYPVVEHRRSTARQATLLRASELSGSADLPHISDTDIQQILVKFVTQLTTLRNELTRFPITYYFYEQDRETALAAILPYLSDLAEQNVKRTGAAGLIANSLGRAIDDYLRFITCAFLDNKSDLREEALAYAADQLREPLRSYRMQPKLALL